MNDSGDMFGHDPAQENKEERPSAARLEEEGQAALFGDPAPPAASEPPWASEAEPQPEPEPEPAPASAPEPAPQAAPSTEPAVQPYRVLARKYRPRTFSELIGQEPMVRTLANAIERDRLAHAFLMTGVRGVGKTSTARLIAKALNCVGPDGQGGPTIDPCGLCEPCRAIAEGRHIDVIEMDAASHTGVDDVREIIEAVRYAAVSARYKIYIIDEVHMLSRNAFNALLKTLEEPPAHVKFLFATTEVDKLPVTVLSRTQRFDLRRIPTAMLADHFASICRQEGIAAEEEALAMIAAAAEGSVRDGLSILDQAIAHADLDGAGGAEQPLVSAERVRDMLGLVDKSALRRIFAALMDGDARALLDEVEKRYALGVEPLALLRSLMELTHRIAVAQVGGGEGDAPTMEERQAVEQWAESLSPGQVHRLWQLLMKGHEEVKAAPDPLVAAQMALLRVLHAVELPDPGTLARQLEDIARNAAAPPADSTGAPAAPARPSAQSWEELVEKVEARNRHRIAAIMRMQVRVVELRPGLLRFARDARYGETIVPDLREALADATGMKWQVEESAESGLPSLIEQEEADRRARREAIRQAPLVQAALAAFPDAEFVEADDAPRGERNWSRTA